MYFKALSLAWGAWMVLTGPVFQFLGRQSDRFRLSHAYPEKRPVCVRLAAMAGVALVAITWFMHLHSEVRYSLVATLIVTLGIVRDSQVLFNYARFRAALLRLADSRPAVITALSVASGVLGMTLILLGLLVY